MLSKAFLKSTKLITTGVCHISVFSMICLSVKICSQHNLPGLYIFQQSSPIYISAEQHCQCPRIYIPAEQLRPYIYQQNSIAQVYISAEQHCPCIYTPAEQQH